MRYTAQDSGSYLASRIFGGKGREEIDPEAHAQGDSHPKMPQRDFR